MRKAIIARRFKGVRFLEKGSEVVPSFKESDPVVPKRVEMVPLFKESDPVSSVF
jgi:hypothetical protein